MQIDGVTGRWYFEIYSEPRGRRFVEHKSEPLFGDEHVSQRRIADWFVDRLNGARCGRVPSAGRLAANEVR